jgi:hypothetical protein
MRYDVSMGRKLSFMEYIGRATTPKSHSLLIETPQRHAGRTQIYFFNDKFGIFHKRNNGIGFAELLDVLSPMMKQKLQTETALIESGSMNAYE